MVSLLPIQLLATVITSSPVPIPSIFMLIYKPSVLFAQLLQCFTTNNLANSASNCCTHLPPINALSAITDAMAASIYCLIDWYYSVKSTKGICI